MSQCLKALYTFKDNPDLVPSTHMEAWNGIKLHLQEFPVYSSDFHKHCIHMVHRHMCRKYTHTSGGEKKGRAGVGI